MYRHRLLQVFVLALGIFTFVIIFPVQAFASSAVDSNTQAARMHVMNNLESAYSAWKIYHSRQLALGMGTMLPLKLPVKNKTAIQLAILHHETYYNLHVYRNLPPADKATFFQMSSSFYLTSGNSTQAIEFHMNKWVGRMRWKFAVQWQTVPDGTKAQGMANSWRIWGDNGWNSIGVVQPLASNTWHTMYLRGEVVKGKVHYLTFDCDGMHVDLSHYTYKPMKSLDGDKLAVAIQLDGAPNLLPSPLDVDNVTLKWR